MDPRIARIAVLTTAALMIVGAVGTWASASAFGISISVNGTDGGRDGRIVIVCAALLAVAALVPGRATGVLGILAALAASATAIYDLLDIQDTTGITVGWGLWLALVASVVGVLDAIMLMVARGRAEPPPASPV
jgi:hypothetical protein